MRTKSPKESPVLKFFSHRLVAWLLWISVCPLTLAAMSSSRDESMRVSEMRFEHLSDRQGLCSNVVGDLYQDSKGFLWIATEKGIDRYDGIRFTHYELDNSAFPSQRRAFCVSEDHAGNLWAGGRRGALERFDPNADAFRAIAGLPSTLAQSDILNFCADPDGILWIGTNQGLVRYDPAANRADFLGPAEPYPMILATALDSRGQLWVGTYRGLRVLDRESGAFELVRLSPDKNIPANVTVSSLFDHPSGTLFVGTGLGIFAVDTARRSWDTRVPTGIPLFLPPGTLQVTSIVEHGESTILVGVRGAGIAVINIGSLRVEWIRHNPQQPDTIAGNNITALLVDRSGVLWVGDFVEGLSKFSIDQHTFRLYRNNPFDERTLSGNYIRGVCEAKDGRIWVCTQFDGLNVLDPLTGQVRRYQLSTGRIPFDGTYDVIEDHAGDVWVGMISNNGLGRLDRRTDRFLRSPLIPGVSVTSFCEDSGGTLWVGTTGGVYEIAKDRRKAVHHPEFLNAKPWSSADDVEALFVDSRGDIWIGLNSRLVTVVRSTGAVIDRSPSLGIKSPETFVSGFLETNDHIWITTKGQGVFIYDRQSEGLSNLTPIDGVPNANTYGILEDRDGRIWISTDDGIVSYDPLNHTMNQFGPQQGLQGKEFNRRAFCRARNGDMYFGGTEGLNGFTPEAVKFRQTPPPVAVSRLLINGVAVPPAADIDLDYASNTIAIELAVLDFNAPDLNRYAVKLEGLDRDWVALGESPQIVYAALKPGDYTLRIRGSNGVGIWGEGDAPMHILINPPWWRTRWAIGIYFVLALGVIGGSGAIVRYRSLTRSRLKEAAEALRLLNIGLEARIADRTAELDAKTRELETFAYSVAHDLKAPLRGIDGYSRLLLEDYLDRLDDDGRAFLHTIRSSTARMDQLIEDLLSYSRLERRTLTSSRIELRSFVESLLEEKKVELESRNIAVSVNINRETLFADASGLSQALRNYVDNAIKFTSKTSAPAIEIGAREDFNGCRVWVRDNGIGFDMKYHYRIFEIFQRLHRAEDYSGTGVGLAIVRKAIERMGGRVWAESVPQSGSTFYLEIPKQDRSRH